MKIKNRIKGLATLPHDRILPCPSNWRMHPDAQKEALRGLLADVGVIDTVLVRPVEPEALATLRKVARGDRAAFDAWFATYRGDFMLIDGHLRVEELQAHGPIDALVVDLDDREAAEALAIFDPIGDLATMDREKFLALVEDFNSTNGAVQSLVADLAKIQTGGPDGFGLEGDGATGGGDPGIGGEDEASAGPENDAPAKGGSLAERFGVPPFSVLNAREGWWQSRKAAWIALGLRSEMGRGGQAGEKLTMSATIQALKPSADQAAKRAGGGATERLPWRQSPAGDETAGR